MQRKTFDPAGVVPLLYQLFYKRLMAQGGIDRVKADISRFIPYPKVPDIWSPKYFHDLVSQMKVIANFTPEYHINIFPH